jgi:uncharacterized protein YxjI
MVMGELLDAIPKTFGSGTQKSMMSFYAMQLLGCACHGGSHWQLTTAIALLMLWRFIMLSRGWNTMLASLRRPVGRGGTLIVMLGLMMFASPTLALAAPQPSPHNDLRPVELALAARAERQQDRSFGRRNSGNVRYEMRQGLIGFGDDFWVRNEAGKKVFKVDGKSLRARDTFILKTAAGEEVCKIQERSLRLKDSMAIASPEGQKLAVVKQALIDPVSDRWTVKLKGKDLDVKGNILNYEYSIQQGRNKLAEVSKKWFRLTDSYGVEIEPGQDDALILAITVAVDAMAHNS